MNASSIIIARTVLAGSCLAGAAVASAHISLLSGAATAGTPNHAVFRVGHPCEGSKTTTALTIRLPDGFVLAQAEPHAGWTQTPSAVTEAVREVSWKANAPVDAVGHDDRGEFALTGTATGRPGTLWFKVLQTCDAGRTDWSHVPVVAADKPEHPAVALQVLAPGVATVQVENAWVRQTVPGQSGTGAFMTLTAPAETRLVSVSSPVAGVAQVHQMKVAGGTMGMRAMDDGLALPAQKPVELTSSGNHIMLMDLKQPLVKGSRVPVKLEFEDAKGVRTSLTVQAPVGMTAAAGISGGKGMASDDHSQHRH